MTKSIPQEKAIFAIYCYTCKTGFINLNAKQKAEFGTTSHIGHTFTGMKKHVH